MKYWVLVLHFYQPPTQSAAVTKDILTFCYLPLLRMLNKKEHFKCTFNISGSLLEQLEALHADEFFILVKKLIADGKVELTGSAMYHTLAPLTPPSLWARQVEKNNAITRKTLGVSVGGGFFPPELAVDTHSMEKIRADYVIVDESATHKYPIAKFNDTYLLVSDKEMIEVFRSYPKELNAHKLLRYAIDKSADEKLMIVPSDAEVLGHHYVERIEFLSQFLDSEEVTFITAREAVHRFGPGAPKIHSVHLSSWQNTTKLKLWTGKKLQKKYLRLAECAATLAGQSHDRHVLELLDKGWSSCHLFWLSNSPWWYPDMVERGAHSLITSVRSTFVDQNKKQVAEKLFYDLMKHVWLYHWSDNVEKGFRRHDKARAKVHKNLPEL